MYGCQNGGDQFISLDLIRAHFEGIPYASHKSGVFDNPAGRCWFPSYLELVGEKIRLLVLPIVLRDNCAATSNHTGSAFMAREHRLLARLILQ